MLFTTATPRQLGDLDINAPAQILPMVNPSLSAELHLNSARHALKYLMSTKDWTLRYTSRELFKR